jgi:hypothetical protein
MRGTGIRLAWRDEHVVNVPDVNVPDVDVPDETSRAPSGP